MTEGGRSSCIYRAGKEGTELLSLPVGLLQQIDREISTLSGEEVLPALCRRLSQATGADGIVIGAFQGADSRRLAVLTAIPAGEFEKGSSIEVAAKPCRETGKSPCCLSPTIFSGYQDGVVMGGCLRGSSGRAVGFLALLSKKGFSDPPLARALVGIFACRAASMIEERQAWKEERKQRHFLQALLDAVPVPIFYKDLQGRYLGCNSQLEAVLGLKRDDLTGRTVSEIAPPERASICHRHDQELFRDRQVRSYESRITYPDGSLHEVVFSKAPFFDFEGRMEGLVGTILDVTQVRQVSREMHRLANYDSLTGLPNLRLLRERLERALGRAGHERRKVAVFFVDLDRFKGINETLGHLQGDNLLKIIADRLQGLVRTSDTVARLSGDEFAVVCYGLESENDAAGLAQRFLDILRQPQEVEGQEIYCSASIGIAVFPEDGQDCENLLRNADFAMYQAKEQGGGNYQFYSLEMNVKAVERLLLETSLRRALEREEFFLHFQPQISYPGGDLIGAEALLRWQHSELGLIPPAKFISLAEETGLIIPIGEWVLRQACLQWRSWQSVGIAGFRMAVNLSSRQFRQPQLVETIQGILEETGMSPDRLELEITESVIMDNAEETSRKLRQLKDMGIHLAIDDFGTGYSSLSYLKHFPLDRLKIDRSFVRDLHADSDDAAIVDAIIALAGILGLDVIAEGVETREQAEFLGNRRCREMQGFLFGKPMVAKDLESFWSASVSGKTAGG